MSVKHSNPTRPRVDKDGRQHWARAPYNFVPLPEKMIKAREPLPHDKYDEKGLTGWIECELETCSPTYVRGMLTEAQYNEQGEKKTEELSEKEKELRAPFFSSTTDEEVEGRQKPVIPGSSLRGMIRALVEIIGYGRVRWVGKEPAFTFRAVAASKDDPLRDPYRDVIGAFGRNVRAGYLERKGEVWYIRPALTPEALRWPSKEAYLKVKERQIGSKDIPGFLRLNSPDYHPQLHKVSFNVEFGKGKSGSFVLVSQIGPSEARYSNKGVLVCTGNMMESGRRGQKSPRKNHALVLAPDLKADTIKINEKAVEGYVEGLSLFQKEELKDWKGNPGCLKEGNPVFYVVGRNPSGAEEVVYFGHCPNFRIPARQQFSDANRAARPLDFVSEKLRDQLDPDLADAIFGWVEENEWGPKDQRAGRVFFSDATFLGARDGVWLKPNPITLHVLSGPKPTTFQHYLTQNRGSGHDPDDKKSLAHYGTSPAETQVRGHKLYWFKGTNPEIEATIKEHEHSSQLTSVIPLKPGVRFSFKIQFENLHEEELGMLWWALALPGDPDKVYRHHLGMGKPLGMGAIALIPRLHLTDRQDRYRRLFKEDGWHEAATEGDAKPYLSIFETFVLGQIGAPAEKKRLADLERIQTLLVMMQWYEDDAKWLDQTRYMEIERGLDKINEYKERPVLPTPQGVLELAAGKTPQREISSPQPRSKETNVKRQASDVSEHHGTVKSFGLGKSQSFGFIQPDGSGPDVFVHLNQLRGVKTLEPGQRVIFKTGKGMKGPAAEDVRLET
jgi:CRISPR-associated protein (TIGR03986 family)